MDCFHSFYKDHSHCSEVISDCHFKFHFPIPSEDEYFFHVPAGYHYIFFGGNIPLYLPYLVFECSFFFLLFSFEIPLYVSDIKSCLTYGTEIYNKISFYLWIFFFCNIEAFSFDIVHLLICFFFFL